jgi:hypothetical protein
LGGTTGQILSKASNTNMDFTWIANDQGDITGVTATSPLTGGGTSGAITVGIQDATTSVKGSVQLSDSTSTTSSVLAATPTAVKAAYDLANAAIAKSFVDAKGDLISATADNTPSIVTVGSNGNLLVADSSATSGLRWQGSIAAGRNFVINGGMDVWQRGASGFGTSTGTYTADRWVLGSSSTTVTRDTDVPVSPYFNYSLKMVGTSDNSIIQRVEAVNSTLLAGQTVTFSFYAKRTAGAGALDVRFYYPTTTDTYGAITQIGSTVVVAASPSSSWTRYTVTAAIGTNITTGLQILINNTGASTTFITGAQLELGSVATNFSRAGGNIAGELAACQRYYQAAGGNNVGIWSGMTTISGTYYSVYPLPVAMRTSPTTVVTAIYGGSGFTAVTTSTVSAYSVSVSAVATGTNPAAVVTWTFTANAEL